MPRSRQLSEVFDVIHEFQCFDVRDRLYGIISSVKWTDDFVPVPDYNKSNFGVVSETLGLLLKEDCWALDWANRLWNLFEVSLDDSSLLKAIDMRSSTL
ncbi:hypothetical protein GQ44DRAFT_818992, partial [Phaeosphaeriaceae sp. PMI808]